MKNWPVFVWLSMSVLTPAVVAKKAAIEYPAIYAGGNLPLDQQKVRATFGKDELVFLQGDRRIAVPVKSISEISCGTELRRRTGASVLDVVPLMHLGESEDYYVGVAFGGVAGSGSRAQMLLKFSRGDYRDFLAALERATGMKAIHTNQVPTVVRYHA